MTFAYENLPTKERTQHSQFDYGGGITPAGEERKTSARLRYRTVFDICLELGYLEPEHEYYHNEFRLMYRAANAGLEMGAADFWPSGVSEEEEPGDTTDQDDLELADRYHEMLFAMTKQSDDALDYIKIVCMNIPEDANMLALRYSLTAISYRLGRSFALLKEIIDNLPELRDIRLGRVCPKIENT